MTTPAHRPLLAVWLDKLLSTLVILLTGAHAQPLPQLRERTAAGRIYYTNHNSHGDFMLIWVSLPYGRKKPTAIPPWAKYRNTSSNVGSKPESPTKNG